MREIGRSLRGIATFHFVVPTDKPSAKRSMLQHQFEQNQQVHTLSTCIYVVHISDGGVFG